MANGNRDRSSKTGTAGKRLPYRRDNVLIVRGQRERYLSNLNCIIPVARRRKDHRIVFNADRKNAGHGGWIGAGNIFLPIPKEPRPTARE